MVLVSEDLMKWDNESLLRGFEQRTELYNTMVGSLYPPIVHAEMEAIGAECIRRTEYHPNWWREKGIVPSSWTDEQGVTHSWTVFHAVQNRKADDPVRVVTCFECLAR